MLYIFCERLQKIWGSVKMKKVKLIITMLSCMLLLSILAPGTSQVIYASENDDSIETNKMFQPEKITILDSITYSKI